MTSAPSGLFAAIGQRQQQYEPVSHDEKGSVRHAHHTKVKTATFIADAETEATIVGTDEMNRLVWLAA